MNKFYKHTQWFIFYAATDEGCFMIYHPIGTFLLEMKEIPTSHLEERWKNGLIKIVDESVWDIAVDALKNLDKLSKVK